MAAQVVCPAIFGLAGFFAHAVLVKLHRSTVPRHASIWLQQELDGEQRSGRFVSVLIRNWCKVASVSQRASVKVWKAMWVIFVGTAAAAFPFAPRLYWNLLHSAHAAREMGAAAPRLFSPSVQSRLEPKKKGLEAQDSRHAANHRAILKCNGQVWNMRKPFRAFKDIRARLSSQVAPHGLCAELSKRTRLFPVAGASRLVASNISLGRYRRWRSIIHGMVLRLVMGRGPKGSAATSLVYAAYFCPLDADQLQ